MKLKKRLDHEREAEKTETASSYSSPPIPPNTPTPVSTLPEHPKTDSPQGGVPIPSPSRPSGSETASGKSRPGQKHSKRRWHKSAPAKSGEPPAASPVLDGDGASAGRDPATSHASRAAEVEASVPTPAETAIGASASADAAVDQEEEDLAMDMDELLA